MERNGLTTICETGGCIPSHPSQEQRGQKGQTALRSFLCQVTAEKDYRKSGHTGGEVTNRGTEAVLCLEPLCLLQIHSYISVAFQCQHLKITYSKLEQ